MNVNMEDEFVPVQAARKISANIVLIDIPFDEDIPDGIKLCVNARKRTVLFPS